MKRLLGNFLDNVNAAHNGIAVAALPKLRMVSANNATLPVKPMTTNWTTAVASNAASKILVA